MPQDVPKMEAFGTTKRRNAPTIQREIILMMTKELSFHHSGDGNFGDEMSSLANSTGHECLESGFDTFTDFLQYSSYQGNSDGKAIWRRRRKFKSLRWLGNLMNTSIRRIRDVLYGLCGMIAMSVTNIVVAFGFLFFLLF